VDTDIVESIREWYQMYKVSDGKKPNFYFGGNVPRDRQKTLAVLAKTHKSWKDKFGSKKGQK